MEFKATVNLFLLISCVLGLLKACDVIDISWWWVCAPYVLSEIVYWGSLLGLYLLKKL